MTVGFYSIQFVWMKIDISQSVGYTTETIQSCEISFSYIVAFITNTPCTFMLKALENATVSKFI